MHRNSLAVLATALLVAACGTTPEASATDEPPAPTEIPMPTTVPPADYPEGSIGAVLRDDGRFSTFLELSINVLVHSEVPRLLNMERNWTVFAPTDEAFTRIPAELLEKMRNDPETAEEMFLHHHMEGAHEFADFELLPSWPTAHTPVSVVIETAEDGYLYDGVRVLEIDIEAANGVIHVLDAVSGLELLQD